MIYIYVFCWIEKIFFHWLHILDFQMLSIETWNQGKKNGNVVRTNIWIRPMKQLWYAKEHIKYTFYVPTVQWNSMFLVHVSRSGSHLNSHKILLTGCTPLSTLTMELNSLKHLIRTWSDRPRIASGDKRSQAQKRRRGWPEFYIQVTRREQRKTLDS